MTGLVEEVKTTSQKAEHIKATIYQYIHKEYNDLFPCKSQVDLLKTIKPLLKDIKKLEVTFEKEIQPQVHAATTQHKDLLTEYSNTKVVTNLLQRLCTCHRELSACRSTPPNQFIKAAKHLQVIKEELDSVVGEGCDVKIFKVLRNEYINEHTKVAINLSEVWDSLIVWNTSTSASWDSMDGHLKTSLRIERSVGETNIDVMKLITAMDIMHILNRTLKTFSQKVYTYLIKPLVKFQNLQGAVHSLGANSHILKITKKATSKNPTTSKSVQHVKLYTKILEVVRFIKTSLFEDLTGVDEHNESNIKPMEDKATNIKPMSLIGSFIWKELSEMIITDHLSAAVPSTNSQMEKFESTIEETIKFEIDLINEEFIPSGTDTLSKCVKDVNVHFANKVCQDILSEARDLMLTEIHNMVEADCKTDRAAMPLPDEGENVLSKKMKNMLSGVEAIDDDYTQVEMFAFPLCAISDWVQKLVDFIYLTMIKATESPYPLACQLLYCGRDMLELFVNVVPTYHKENLKLPQMSAVHYNNCMYLAHHCITLGHQFRNSLPGQLNSTFTTFIDFVPILRKCGTDCFLEQLRSQQRELLQILEGCSNFTECTTDKGAEAITRAFNQIIHHMTRVAKQWYLVLPINIFKQSLGVLLNTVLENILACIFKMEDISAEEGGQLHALLSILMERSPEIIQSCSPDIIDAGINDQIRSWSKFQGLVQLLEGSLQEIVEMWEGELSLCMNEGEVRTLIRALFQNTDRRSQALSKIKHKQEKS